MLSHSVDLIIVVVHTGVDEDVSRVFNGSARMCVCVNICQHSALCTQTKVIRHIITKLGRWIVHDNF